MFPDIIKKGWPFLLGALIVNLIFAAAVIWLVAIAIKWVIA